MKREICNKCQQGDKIEHVPAIEPIGPAYKKSFNEDSKKCVGCWWYNHLRPKHPNLLPGLKEAKQKHQEKINLVMNKACLIKPDMFPS